MLVVSTKRGRTDGREFRASRRRFSVSEAGEKIYDLGKTLIISIHKARSIPVRRYAAVGHASGLIKNDDRKGRKLRGAYRPINSTSASICLSLSLSLSLSLPLPHFLSVPILPFPDFPPFHRFSRLEPRSFSPLPYPLRAAKPV